MTAMVAVDEFELGSAHVPRVDPPPVMARRRGDRPSGCVGLAVAAVALGALAAPVTLPRAAAAIPEWGGLDGVTYVTVDDDIDAVSLARDAVGFFASYDDERRPTGTVVVLLRDLPAGERPASSLVNPGADVGVQTTFDYDLFTALEAAANRSDWVCEPTGDQAVCTALADPEITLLVDWRNP